MPRDPNPPPPTLDASLQNVPTIEGFKVLGKTILLEQIGIGGMGVVYRGWHMTFRIDVAVKVLKPSLAEDRDYVSRFRREAQAALKITHQNVVRAYDVEERHGLHFFVMEFVDGESAWQRVGRLGRMQPAEALTIFTGAAAGLAEAHGHGLVHRDVKPGNLLIARSGRVKVADLGLVRPAVDADDPADQGTKWTVLGTPQYMAPEQWTGAPARPTADVWALGATLYYLLTGQHGLPRMPNRELRRWVAEHPLPTLSRVLSGMPELDRIFERCVRRDPEARFASAVELQQALLALGPGDESLLRDNEPARPLASLLPSNEVLGRIDARLKRPEPVVAARRRAPVAQRSSGGRSSSNAGIVIAVVVAAAITIVGVVLYLRSAHKPGDASTQEHGSVVPALPAETSGDAASPARGTADPVGVLEASSAAASIVVPVIDRVEPASTSRVPIAALRIFARDAKEVTVDGHPAAQLGGDVWTWAGPSARGTVTFRIVARNGDRQDVRQHTLLVAGPPEPAVEAAAKDVAPVADDASLRTTLLAWLDHCASPAHYESHFVRHRDAVLRARDAGAAGLPDSIDACLAALEDPMRAFPGVGPASVPTAVAEPLLTQIGAMRQKGASIEPLLPWLLLLQKNEPSDPTILLFLFEACAVDGLDAPRAKAAAGQLQRVLAAPVAGATQARLQAAAFELQELGDDGVALLASAVQKLADERVEQGALGPFAVAKTLLPEIDARYEKLMQAGDFAGVARALQAMLVLDPTDRAPELVLAMVTGRHDVSFDYTRLTEAEQSVIDQRARRLGLDLLAPGLAIAAVILALGDEAASWRPFFSSTLDQQVAEQAAKVDGADQKVRQNRDKVRRLDNDAQKWFDVAARRRDARGRSEAIANGKDCQGKAQIARDQTGQFEAELDAARKELRQLEATAKERSQQRSTFCLQ